MAGTYIPSAVRQAVVARAESICEYCLVGESECFFDFHIDHIISQKHIGGTILENLAYSCFACNQAKGTDIATLDPDSGKLTRFFNPRMDRWADHFELRGFRIVGLTAIGRGTAQLFRFNDDKTVGERELLMKGGFYPNEAAFRRIRP
jgi:hypothetical protein